ncbi:MAG: PfkB family carbohydrate kinase [Planctomycetota bacterium]
MAAGPFCIAVGEALYDRFGDVEVLGGAPVNFSVHLAALLAPAGGRVSVLTRIGRDERGTRLSAELDVRGVDRELIQIDETLPTSIVNVSVDEAGQPTYDIARPVGWDAIEVTDDALAAFASADAVCFGTLAQRDDRSRGATVELLKACAARVRLFDANLRPDFSDDSILIGSLGLATIFKLNEHELPRVRDAIGSRNEDRRTFCTEVMSRFDLDAVVLTRGGRGTEFHTSSGCIAPKAPAVEHRSGSDAVGAGDACAAGIVAGLLADLPLERTVALANELGAFVVSQRGATPELPSRLRQRVSNHLSPPPSQDAPEYDRP